MEQLSQNLLAAGWVLEKKSDTHWTAVSPDNHRFEWEAGGWYPGREEVEKELERNNLALAAKNYTPFFGTSRLSATPLTPAVHWLGEQRRLDDQTLLRLRTAPDPEGDQALYNYGARRVDTLCPPWPKAGGSVRDVHYHLLLGEHVLDALPKPDREKVLPRCLSHLHPDGKAYFTCYEPEGLPSPRPKETAHDGYVFTRGLHRVFLRGYLPQQAERELTRLIGGYAETLHQLKTELICLWRNDV